MSEIISLLEQLIAFESVTPYDAGTQAFMIRYLEALGFTCEVYNHPPVSNFFARWGTREPLLLFAGHTDVVAAGDLSAWHTPPFELHEKDGMLYGRGVADMKGSLAAMLIAAKHFVAEASETIGSLGFLITSGEEGDDFDCGTPHIVTALANQGCFHQKTYCILGEPSSTEAVGDMIKIGRRGSLTATIRIVGKQGHVAYPQFAINPIHEISSVLHCLATHSWDEGNAYFPPTTLQITHIHAGGLGGNVIPGELGLQFNVRYSTEQTDSSIRDQVEAYFKEHGVTAEISWRLNGTPFLTSNGRLLDTTVNVITATKNKTPILSTTGGTSDGRFIAPFGIETLELGPVNKTIHQANECVLKSDLVCLANLYYSIAKALLQP